MAAYERVTLNRGGRNSRFDCKIVVPLFGAANAAPNKGTTSLY